VLDRTIQSAGSDLPWQLWPMLNQFQSDDLYPNDINTWQWPRCHGVVPVYQKFSL